MKRKETVEYDSSYTVSSPLEVKVSSRKHFILNMNQMRTTHFRVLAKAKAEYTRLMRYIIRDLPIFKQVELTFIMYPKTRRLCDVDNVCSVQAKFFQDALVHWGKIEDDNYNYIKDIHFAFGKVSKDRPRVDVIIRPVSKEDQKTRENLYG